ncbi:transposase [Pedobacter sp. 22226]|uniref:transposase n=1 Tax=Pedobacter sp. 22226 TaxID=3453894 RepID=UPI003F868CFD
MEKDIFKQDRNSKMLLDEVYFWTDTVKDWKKIFSIDKYKIIVIDTLRELVNRKKITVYAFVIMPNHLHLVWQMIELNGKEMPHASFNKFTSHQIFQDLKLQHPEILPYFKVSDRERNFRLWQRDPLAILMDTTNKLEQKIDYIHNNPLQERWQLCENPEDYEWSSARFYETGIDNFEFLTDYRGII